MVFFSAPTTGSVNIIEQFGKFHSVKPAGLSVIWPCIGQVKAGNVSLRLQSLKVRCETKTSDNVFVFIEICVQYKVRNADGARSFYYSLSDPKGQMTALIFDVVRSLVPKLELDALFTTKQELAEAVQSQLKEAFGEFGITIISSPVTDIDPAQTVKAAMNQIQTMQRLKVAASDEAEAAKIKQVKRAEAAGESTRIDAAAQAEATYLSGVGMARQRHAILNGMKDDVDLWGEVRGMEPSSVVAIMLQSQYYSTLETIGGSRGSNTIFVPSNPGAVNELTDQLRDSMLMADAAKPRAAASQLD